MEHKEIEKTLESLNGMQKAEPDAFFYDRLISTLENREVKVISIAPRLVWQAAAGLLLLVAMNIFVWSRATPNENTQTAGNPVAQEYFSYMKSVQL